MGKSAEITFSPLNSLRKSGPNNQIHSKHLLLKFQKPCFKHYLNEFLTTLHWNSYFAFQKHLNDSGGTSQKLWKNWSTKRQRCSGKQWNVNCSSLSWRKGCQNCPSCFCFLFLFFQLSCLLTWSMVVLFTLCTKSSISSTVFKFGKHNELCLMVIRKCISHF